MDVTLDSYIYGRIQALYRELNSMKQVHCLASNSRIKFFDRAYDRADRKLSSGESHSNKKAALRKFRTGR